MYYQVRFTKTAKEDLERLYTFLAKENILAAEQALKAISKGMDLLQNFPFTCRKATPNNTFLRELIISFGASGYVALFEIESDTLVTILAVRHQREDDFR